MIFLFLCNFCFNFDFQAMVFTDPEKFALVEIFIEKGRSYVRFVRQVRRERGQNAQIPIEQTLKKWIGRLRETGSAQSHHPTNFDVVARAWSTVNLLRLPLIC